MIVIILGVEAGVALIGSVVVYIWARRRGIGQRTGSHQYGGRYAQPAQQGYQQAYVPYRG